MTGRFCHQIKPGGRGSRPANLMFVAVETESVSVRPGSLLAARRFVGAYTISVRLERGRSQRRHEGSHHHRQSVWDSVLRALDGRRPLWLFCADLLHVWTTLGGWNVVENNEPKSWRIYLGDPPTVLRGRIGGKSVRVCDMRNYFPAAASDATPRVGLRDGAANGGPGGADDHGRDVKVAAESVERMMLEYLAWHEADEMGAWGTTAAAVAMRSWKADKGHIFPCCHGDEKVLGLEASCYYGGRAEAHRTGKIGGKLTLLDVNSLFPSVMKRYPHPTRLVQRRASASPDWVRLLCRTHFCAANVWVRTDEPRYPKRLSEREIDDLSGRKIDDNHGKKTSPIRVVYPVGTFRTHLCGHELESALDRDEVLGVDSLAVYEVGDMFSGWVERMWRRRMTYKDSGNIVWEKAIKAVLVSLYGKFAQHAPEKVEDGRVETDITWGRFWAVDPETGDYCEHEAMAGVTYRMSQRLWLDESLPVVSASITSAGRVVMGEVCRVAGPGNVVLEDTDAVLVTDVGLTNLADAGFVDQRKLGSLKVVNSGDGATVYGAKDYEFAGSVKMSGVPRNAVRAGDSAYDVLIREGASSLVRRVETEMAFSSRMNADKAKDSLVCHGSDVLLERATRLRMIRLCRTGVVRADGGVVPLEVEEALPPHLLPPPPSALVSRE